MEVEINSLTDTWDDAGTTFNAIKMNVTDTASAAASLLMDLQVGGASRFRVRKDGRVTIPVGQGLFGDQANELGIQLTGNQVIDLHLANFNIFRFQSNGSFTTRNTGSINWTNGTSASASTVVLSLFRDADDTLAQRRGTNPQALRVYNTFTDGSNYERGFMRWAANVFEIGTAAEGTGTKRNLVLDGANRAAYSETPADIAAALVSHGIMAPA